VSAKTRLFSTGERQKNRGKSPGTQPLRVSYSTKGRTGKGQDEREERVRETEFVEMAEIKSEGCDYPSRKLGKPVLQLYRLEA